jgi:hypothetical protein
LIVKTLFSHVTFSLWSRLGSGRRKIALYEGDSGLSGFIPGDRRLVGGTDSAALGTAAQKK